MYRSNDQRVRTYYLAETYYLITIYVLVHASKTQTVPTCITFRRILHLLEGSGWGGVVSLFFDTNHYLAHDNRKSGLSRTC